MRALAYGVNPVAVAACDNLHDVAVVLAHCREFPVEFVTPAHKLEEFVGHGTSLYRKIVERIEFLPVGSIFSRYTSFKMDFSILEHEPCGSVVILYR